MNTIRRLVLDILKPLDLSLPYFTQHITEAETIDAATTSLIELDNEIQNTKLTVDGSDLDNDQIDAALSDSGGTVYTIDQVACGDTS